VAPLQIKEVEFICGAENGHILDGLEAEGRTHETNKEKMIGREQ